MKHQQRLRILMLLCTFLVSMPTPIPVSPVHSRSLNLLDTDYITFLWLWRILLVLRRSPIDRLRSQDLKKSGTAPIILFDLTFKRATRRTNPQIGVMWRDPICDDLMSPCISFLSETRY